MIIMIALYNIHIAEVLLYKNYVNIHFILKIILLNYYNRNIIYGHVNCNFKYEIQDLLRGGMYNLQL